MLLTRLFCSVKSASVTCRLSNKVCNLNSAYKLNYKSFIMKRSFTIMTGAGEAGAKPKIGTHNGVFHCDEVLACFLLKQIEELKDAEIVRTRDPDILRECTVVVDVGGVYDPESHRYDHHQRAFDFTFSSIHPEFQNKIKLSSAGLIYSHFGEKIIEKILSDVNLTETELSLIYGRVYDAIIEEIDGIDNGVPQYLEGSPAYKIRTHLSERIGRMNPEWNAPVGIDVNTIFNDAMEIVGKEFLEVVIRFGKTWLPARTIVEKAIVERFQVHSSGAIIELKPRCPWQDHLFTLEKELNINSIKFVLFEDTNGSWRVQCIPVELGSFICRKFVKEEWFGLRDEKLSEKAGVPDCVFCHATGFIAGCKSRDGVLQLALKSLD